VCDSYKPNISFKEKVIR